MEDKDITYKGSLSFRSQTISSGYGGLKQLEDFDILVVDDSPDNQTLLEAILTRAGARVEIAVDGLEGAQKALRGNFDIIIMDIQMPCTDGYQALQILQENNYDRPVIALTAHAMREERERAFTSGFTDFATKPVNRRALLALLEKYVHGGNANSTESRH